jgi:hypothetical protein
MAHFADTCHAAPLEAGSSFRGNQGTQAKRPAEPKPDSTGARARTVSPRMNAAARSNQRLRVLKWPWPTTDS